jgi:hypothetical protein
MTDNNRSQHNITRMLRRLIIYNVTDPLDETSRDTCDYTEYFTGTNAIGQINYLERKITSTGRCIVKVSGVTKTITTDYTLDRNAGTITWVLAQPATTDNIEVTYRSRKPWVYDDHPFLNTNTFPRITVDLVRSEYTPPGLMTYQNYNSGTGDYIKSTYKIIVRNRQSNTEYVYNSVHLKNFDLVSAIKEQIQSYFDTNRYPSVWQFNDWIVVDSNRVRTEEDSGIFRYDITLVTEHFDRLGL